MDEHGELQPSGVPDAVWHYTTASGLLGILKDDCIWASSINFLNDATENRKAKQLLRDSVSKRIDSASEADYNKIVEMLKQSEKNGRQITHEDYNEQLRKLLSSKVWDQSEDNVFVTCFSKKKDSLSQWRAYTAVGGSYAIGFETKSLMKLYAYPDGKQGHDFVRRRFSSVEYYSPDVHDSVFDSIAQALIVQSLQGPNGGETWIDILLGDTSPFFKDEAFREEEEWRLVCSGNISYVGLQFRPGRSHLVPYIAVSLVDIPDAIKAIIVGPGPNVDLDVRAIRDLVDARCMNMEVTKSKIPFRNW
jgi:hypothetical protein